MVQRKFFQYLHDIHESAEAIFQFISGLSYDDFAKDRKTYSAVIREFTIIGEAAGKIPEEIKEKYAHIQWRDIVDFRNILIHAYFGVDAEIVWLTIQEDLPELLKTVKIILQKDQLKQ